MENSEKLITVKSISFGKDSNELRINGHIIDQPLSYESTFYSNASRMNVFINALQKLNPDVEIAAMLEVENYPDGDQQYFLNLTNVNSIVPMSLFENDYAYKQICA